MPRRPIRLPTQWSKHVRSSVLHAIALASVAVSYARGRASGNRRLKAQLDQATSENALLREELNIKDSRWARTQSRRRPYYTPVERMRILQLRAARGWTSDKTASVFLIDEQTLFEWMRRLDETGARPLVQTTERFALSQRYATAVSHTTCSRRMAPRRLSNCGASARNAASQFESRRLRTTKLRTDTCVRRPRGSACP